MMALGLWRRAVVVEEEVRGRCGRGHPCEMEVGAKVLNRKHVWGEIRRSGLLFRG